jgi:hypothetical protein
MQRTTSCWLFSDLLGWNIREIITCICCWFFGCAEVWISAHWLMGGASVSSTWGAVWLQEALRWCTVCVHSTLVFLELQGNSFWGLINLFLSEMYINKIVFRGSLWWGQWRKVFFGRKSSVVGSLMFCNTIFFTVAYLNYKKIFCMSYLIWVLNWFCYFSLICWG